MSSPWSNWGCLRKARVIAGFGALALAVPVLGCVESEDEIQDGSPLEFRQLDDDAMIGTMQFEDLTVEFSSRQVAPQVFALELRYGDVTFTGEYDYNTEVFLLDGFVTSTGADIVVNDADMLIVDELGRALSEAKVINSYRPDVEHERGVVLQTPGSAMARLLAVWNARGVGESPEHAIAAVHGRSIDYLCGYLTGYGIQASHDCWDCWDYWDGWNYINIGPGGANNCYPDSCSPSCSNYNINRCGKLSCEQNGGGPNGSGCCPRASRRADR